MSSPTDTPRQRRRWRRSLVVASPLLLIVLAVLGLFADLRIEDATNGVGSTLTAPLQFGIYLSPESEKSLDSLLSGAATPDSPSWQLQIEANYQGTDGLSLGGDEVPGVAEAEFSFGPLQSVFPGYTTIGESADYLDGALPNSVDIVFVFPAGSPGGDSETCAEWEVAGAKHSATGVILPGGGGHPDIMVCHIPAIPAFTSLQITAFAMVPVKSLVPSLVGTSSISVTNPRNLEMTMSQDRGVVPSDLMHGPGQEYDLYLQPPSGSTFTDIEPGPTGIGLRTRQIPIGPGESMAAAMVDSRRHNVIDILQQALLLLSGTFFGLVPAVLPFAAKARRKPHKPTEQPGPVEQPSSAEAPDASESESRPEPT